MWSDACKSILFSLDGWMEYLSACLASVGQPCLSFSMTGRASGAKHTPCQPKGRWTGFWWSTAGCKCRGIKRGSVKRSIAVTGDQAAMAGWVSLLFFLAYPNMVNNVEACWSYLGLDQPIWFAPSQWQGLMSIELHSGSHCHVTSKYFKCCCLLAAAHQTGRVEEPATLPETPPSAAGRKSGVEQKAGREGARHKDQ